MHLVSIEPDCRKFNQTVELAKLQEYTYAIVADEEKPKDIDPAQFDDLMLVGTSMGGARPKSVVEDDGCLWIAKFNRPDDKWNVARVEHAMLVLARECHIKVAQSKVTTVGNRDTLMVKRFDREPTREGYRRARMLSALTLLRSEDTHQHRDTWSYPYFAEELRRISSQPKADAQELFRRMVFNALVSNLDDHPRNHAVLAKHQDWRLSPAYDLTPLPAVSLDRRDLAMVCGELGRYANRQNLLSEHSRFLLQTDEAIQIADTLANTVRHKWRPIMRRSGVSDSNCELLANAFVYPGFFYEQDPM